MKKALLSIFAMLFVAWPFAVEAQKRKIPEGARIRGNKVIAKAGYTLEKRADGWVVMVKKAPGGPVITGRFRCSCAMKSDSKKPGGSCDFGTVGGDSAQCYPQDNCTRCALETIVEAPQKTTPANHRY
jgi:hypothetical protein